MSSLRSSVVLTVAVPLVLACGGTAGLSGPSALTDATPRYDALALDVTSADVTGGTNPAALTVTAPSTALLAATDPCHPHLFLRTDAVALRFNAHLYKFLRHVEAVIQNDPTLSSTSSVTWQRTRGTVEVKFTVTRSATNANAYTWLLELRPALSPTAAFTTVFSGAIDRTGATAPHQGTGTMTLDLTALHSVQPLEPASGTITASFLVTATTRTIVVDASGVTWDNSWIADDLLARTPRTAQYVFTREPGKGGSLKIKDQMTFFCPANPGAAVADVSLVARWYRTSVGTVHGRSDARMTGGQLPTGNRIVGVTCSESGTELGDFGERFWLMKEEDSAGGTVPGLAFSDTSGLSPCDPAFGATVPSLGDASADFDFSAVDFSSATPYPFPKP